MRNFDYESHTAVDEALASLSGGDDVRPLAGGTDLLTLMKCDVYAPERLVNIKTLGGMRGIEYDASRGLRLGALTTLAEIEKDESVRRNYPALAEALALAATAQLRNVATVGGNLLQRPRCWYFRNPHVACWLKGGAECPMVGGENQLAAIFGQSACWAVHPSDLAPVLIMLNAEVETRRKGTSGSRRLVDLLQPPTEERRSETLVEPDELITAVRVPPPGGLRSVYLKTMDRKIWAFALVSVAAGLDFDGSRVRDARIVLGGVANVPVRATGAEQALIGQGLGAETIAAAAFRATDGAQPLSHNGYKLSMVQAVVRAALEALAG